MSKENDKATMQIGAVCNHPSIHTLKEVIDQAPELSLVDSLGKNTADPSTMIEDLGESATATVRINPDTGEHMILSIDDNGLDDLLTEEDKQRIEDNVLKNLEESEHLNPTLEEIRQVLHLSPDFNVANISDIALYQLIGLIKKIQRKEKVNVYRELPEELRKEIDRSATMNGFGGCSVAANTAKHAYAETVVDEFINQLQVQKFSADLNEELSKIMDDGSEMLIGYALDNHEKYHNILKNCAEKYEEQGEYEKVQQIQWLLDSIHDGFTLEPLKEAARNHKIKIKKFDIEKPSRAIKPFLAKYINSTTRNIQSPYNAMKAVYRNTRGKDPIEVNDIYLFFVAFAKFCQNYDINNVVQHAFMYYVLYNCMMLDFRDKNGRNQDFVDGFIKNIKEVIDLLKNK